MHQPCCGNCSYVQSTIAYRSLVPVIKDMFIKTMLHSSPACSQGSACTQTVRLPKNKVPAACITDGVATLPSPPLHCSTGTMQLFSGILCSCTPVSLYHWRAPKVMVMLLQCCATSARRGGTLHGTALMRGRPMRAPKSACAVAKASVQQQERRITTGTALCTSVINKLQVSSRARYLLPGLNTS